MSSSINSRHAPHSLALVPRENEDNRPAQTDTQFPPRKCFSVVPPTPKKRSRVTDQRLVFSHPTDLFDSPILATTSIFKKFLIDLGFSSTAYITPLRRNLTVIKQSATMNCGPTCAMMLILDRHNNLKDAQLSYDFVEKTHTNSLSNSSFNYRLIKEEGLNPALLKFISNDTSPEEAKGSEETLIFDQISGTHILQKTKELIESSNRSIALSITHPRIDGHWIIIDEFKTAVDGSVFIYIRDPATGKAYRVPQEELSEMIIDECAIVNGFYIR